ncbi:hypothetical protein EV175_001026 [Coemansia sp. RSA 1933]|nr:hypothetical protein EV175_001026 [Coemansia sp. RSA 1933]
MSANRESSNHRSDRGATNDEAPRRRPHPPTPQPPDEQTAAVDDFQFNIQELGLDRDSLEGMWQRLLSSAPDDQEGSSSTLPRLPPRARPPRTSSAGARRAQHILTSSASGRRMPSLQWQPITSRWESSWRPRRQSVGDESDGSADHSEDWTFVNMRPWQVNTGGSATSPPRARRRLSGARRLQLARGDDDSSATQQQHPSFGFTYEERSIDGSQHGSSDDDNAAGQAADNAAGQAADDAADVEELLASANGMDYEQALFRNPIGSTLWRMIMARDVNGAPVHTVLRARSADALHSRAPTPYVQIGGSPPASVATSVVIRQPWNKTTIPWRPYVYQQPLPNSNAQVRNVTERYKHHALPGTDADKTNEYQVHSGVRTLPVDCTNADDMGRGTLDNMFTTNSTLYITSGHENVHLELSLASQESAPQHSVVERILVRSSMASPPCCELMVFASSRRCNFSEFARYNGYTFEKYERLAAKVASGGTVKDPIPIAYFWLSEEEEYQQMQILPHGVCCKYLYLKLLRGRSSNQRMSLRLVRVFGWNGPRAFAEATMC